MPSLVAPFDFFGAVQTDSFEIPGVSVVQIAIEMKYL
jgi:hypothetical protein